MADLDRQKEVVTFLRTLFFFLLATLFGLIGFEFLHFTELTNLQLILINVIIVMFSVIEISVVIIIKKSIDKLKDL